MVASEVELAIVGGGPAGMATALFALAASPALEGRVVVLEKERFPREKICAGAIGGRADKALASIGVVVDVPSVVVSGLSVDGRSGALAEPRREPIGRVVRRLEFDAELARIARARGTAVVDGARVKSIDFLQSGVRLTTEAGEVRARVVVGADGVGSFVRRTLGLPRGRFHAQVAEVDTAASPRDHDRRFLHFDLSDWSYAGYAWDFPTIVEGRPLVCRGVYDLRDEASRANAARAKADVGDLLARRLDALGVSPVGPVKRFAERGLALHEASSRPRALLVGEAAGIDPVLGEGIAQAILYGATAGPYLARCLSADALDFADWPSTLRRSRVGFDLAVRARAAPHAYGPRRDVFERWVTTSRRLAVTGMHYFSGEHVPRMATLVALAELASAFASPSSGAEKRATSPLPPSGASSSGARTRPR